MWKRVLALFVVLGAGSVMAPAAGADETYQRPDEPDVIEAGSECTFFGRDHVLHADVRSLDGDAGAAPAAWDQWLVDNSMNQAPNMWANKAASDFTVWGTPILVTNSGTTTTAKVNVWNPTTGIGKTYLPNGSTRYVQSSGVINGSAPGVASVKTVELRIKSAWKALPVLTGPLWALTFSADKAFIEGDYPQNFSDRHMLVADTTDCRSTEFILTKRPGLFGNALSNGGYEFSAGSAVEWDLGSTSINRGENGQFAGVTAPRNPIAGATVRREEISDAVAANFDGRNDDTPLDHALRFCLPASLIRDDSPVWPAAATDGTNSTGSTDADAPRMGSRLRLRDDRTLQDMLARPGGAGWDDTTPIASGQPSAAYAKAIFDALKVYGMILSDSCVDNWSISGDPDSKWTNAELTAIKTLRLSDFELVDAEPMRAVTGTLDVNTSQPTLEANWFRIN